jgi:hypothetical protein
LIFPNDPIAAEAHLAFQRSCTARAMVAPPNLIKGHGRRFTAKITTLSADEHGQNAAKRGKHLQACPFDTGTMEWRQWREGFLSVRAQSNPWSMPHSATHFVIGGLQ